VTAFTFVDINAIVEDLKQAGPEEAYILMQRIFDGLDDLDLEDSVITFLIERALNESK
jgi:hypothetical protein